jgi:hypothetical protein
MQPTNAGEAELRPRPALLAATMAGSRAGQRLPKSIDRVAVERAGPRLGYTVATQCMVTEAGPRCGPVRGLVRRNAWTPVWVLDPTFARILAMRFNGFALQPPSDFIKQEARPGIPVANSLGYFLR